MGAIKLTATTLTKRVEHLEHTVYRCFAADDELLYIGCTINLGHRMSVHRSDPRSSPWLSRVTRIDAEVYPNRLAGRTAERDAIAAEHPKFNKAHAQREVA